MFRHRFPAAVVLLTALTALVAPPFAAGASNWNVPSAGVSAGAAQSGPAPASPNVVTSACTSFLSNTVDLSWVAVPGAATYTVSESTTSSATGFAPMATGITDTVWTTPPLAAGTYWFTVSAVEGGNWVSADSPASDPRTIALILCT